MALSTTVSDSTSLPETLRQTKGPGQHETTCPICYDPLEPDTPTVEHIGCGRRFDDECLRFFLQSASKYPKCPVCRADLVAPNPWDMSAQQRAQTVLAAQSQLPAPKQFALGWAVDGLTVLLKSRNPTKSYEELRNIVLDEKRLSQSVLETVGLHEGLSIISTQDLVHRSEELGFNYNLKQQLWEQSRIMGYSQHFLHRSSAVPDVGVWAVVPSWIEVVQDQAELQEFFRDDVLQSCMHNGSSELIQVPVPVDLLSWYIGPMRKGPHPSRFSWLQSDQLTKNGITHWAVLDFRHVPDGPELVLMPWPREQILDGFDYLEFPGWGPRDCSVTCGWENELDSEFLEKFVGTERLRFVQGKTDRQQFGRCQCPVCRLIPDKEVQTEST